MMSAPSKGFPLNGCDTFMLAMDGDMRRHGSPGNICHLLLTLQHGVDLERLVSKMRQLPLFAYVSCLRLHSPFLRIPRWRFRPQTQPSTPVPSLRVSTTEELESYIVEHSVDVRREAPFGVVLIPDLKTGPSLLFYWHHSLCDARGGEALVRSLAEDVATDPKIPRNPDLPSGIRALRLSQTTKRSLFAKAAPSIARCGHTTTSIADRKYARLRFTPQETTQIDQLSRTITNGIFPMALLLGATARAASALPFTSAESQHPLFIPVPHDMRRFIRSESAFSNHISFLFFKLTPWLDADLRETTNRVVEQLHESVYAELHWGMLCFLRYIRRLPGWLMWKVIEMPTRGHPASLYFSDVGAGLSQLLSFLGTPIMSASHYPPHLSPPGLTAVWVRYQEQLEVIVCYDAARIGRDGITRFESRLREELLKPA